MEEKEFGSGHFGEWIRDEFGLPAYRYTCNQLKDPKAVTPVNPANRSPREHLHQVGNDRLVAVASNFGYVQVRQDEGGPKFLNDYDPQNSHFAGGFGYLTDGKFTLSTFFTGKTDEFERIFGIGYYRKVVKAYGYRVDQVIFAPFGDDPLLISQVTITNNKEEVANLRWIEYWGCQMYQFSHRAQVISTISGGRRRVADLRREFADRFTQRFCMLDDNAGLLNTKKFKGYSLGSQLTWGIDQVLLATVGRKTSRGALRPPVKQAWLEDQWPPDTFLVSLDAPPNGISADERAFFGAGGVEQPDGLDAQLPSYLKGKEGTAMLLERQVQLPPGESQALYFAYGYLPQGFMLGALLEKYRQDLPGLWTRSSQQWKDARIHFEVPDLPWVGRELTWHNYYLRSDLTYDSFFQEHILSQGHVYQYVIGFQGAARDPLQHALPFIYSQPDIVKQVIRYTLKEVLPDGEIPYAVTGHGMRMAVPFRPSDLELWLLWAASEYVLANRDTEFLDEVLPTFPIYGPKAGKERVRNLLARCFHHLVNETGIGRHGLLRLSNGDWNDGAVIGFVPEAQHDVVRQEAESVLNAAFATYVLDLYAQMLTYTGDHTRAEEALHFAEEQRKAVREQWLGRWFRRAWLSQDLGWIGEKEMWLEPQPWAMIGGAASPEQNEALVKAIDELVRRPSPIGAMLLSQSLEQIPTAPGDLTNAGVWPSINGTLIWALALQDGAMAWEEWQKNSLAGHAEAYPDTWYGIWSGPDTYNSAFSKFPGQTYFDEKALQGGTSDSPLGSGTNWTDFPVMNMHPHAWPLYDVPRLLGVKFSVEGVDLAPCLPLPAYRFESPLLGLVKSSHGYNGWYAPDKAGEWQFRLHLPEVERQRFTRLIVNGEEQMLGWTEDCLQWSGMSLPGSPLRWSLTWSKQEESNA
jgi:hypothetical protein